MSWAALTVVIGTAIAVAIAFGAVWVAKELRAVFNDIPGDTYTENVRPFMRHRWVRILLQVCAVLVIVLAEAGVAAVVWFTWFHIF